METHHGLQQITMWQTIYKVEYIHVYPMYYCKYGVELLKASRYIFHLMASPAAPDPIAYTSTWGPWLHLFAGVSCLNS